MELACRAQEHDFDLNGDKVRRGVVSYHAAATLQSSLSMEAWLQAIHQSAARDVASQSLPARLKPTLTLLGNPAAPAPGA